MGGWGINKQKVKIINQPDTWRSGFYINPQTTISKKNQNHKQDIRIQVTITSTATAAAN